jgi:hypothetical protein
MITLLNIEDTYKALDNNDEALFSPNYDAALIGTYELERDGENVIVGCYDYYLLVDCFAKEFSVDCEEDEDPVEQAMEWVNYNIVGAYVGKFTPMIVYKNEEGEYSSE